MRIAMTGQQIALCAVGRGAALALTAMLGLALAACTTVEGTNALTDPVTFEREVMSSNARGLGLIPGEAPKEDLTQARAPLVLPQSGQALPAPTSQVAATQLPRDSDTVQIDASNLSEADLQRLRNARVVDLRSVAGRPLTEEEARTLTARMQRANRDVRVDNSRRALYMPPDEYFTRVGDANLICSAPGGALVAIDDPACPEAVRTALRQSRGSNVMSTPISRVGVGLNANESKLD